MTLIAEQHIIYLNMERIERNNVAERLIASFSLIVGLGVGQIIARSEVPYQPNAQNLAIIPKRLPISGAQELEIDEPDFLSHLPKNRMNRRAQQFGHVAITYSHKIL